MAKYPRYCPIIFIPPSKECKAFILLAVMLALFSMAFSQAPEKMSFQAVIRDSQGELVVNHPVGIRIQIKKGSFFGLAVYVETHSTMTGENGLASLEIGGGTVVTGSFSGIHWESDLFFLHVEIDPAGGKNYSIVNESQFFSVPYALHAKTAGQIAGGLQETDPVFVSSVAGGITGTDTSRWNNKISRVVENDPVYGGSVAKSISSADTARWNHKINLENQTLADVLALGNDAMGRQIKNIASPVHDQDVATKIYLDELEARYNMLKNTVTGTGPVSDADGNVYNTAKFGDYIWMTENLATTHLNDGTAIASVKELDKWSGLTTPAYCWYNNDNSYKIPYGALYNSYTINTGKLCPLGWHVPGREEWETLVFILGGMDVAGGKMKEAGVKHWLPPNTGATNSSGFSALPGGFRDDSWDGTNQNGFNIMGYRGFWWSDSEYSFGQRVYTIHEAQVSLETWPFEKSVGASVRCKMDDNLSMADVPTVTTAPVSGILQYSANTGGTVTRDGGSTVVAKGVCWSTSPHPDTSDFNTMDGYAPGAFSSFLPALTPYTTYYIRAYATNGIGTGYGNEISLKTLKDFSYDSITDIQGNVYKIVVIGHQTWMAENLKTTLYKDNKAITLNPDGNGIPGYRWYNDDEAAFKSPYGALYNWYAVNTGKLCPAGWKVPANSDWDSLISFLGDYSTAGLKLKETGTSHWNVLLNATNETGFTALPGGTYVSGIFRYIGENGFWWTADEDSRYSSQAWQEIVYSKETSLNNASNPKEAAISVRCLKE